MMTSEKDHKELKVSPALLDFFASNTDYAQKSPSVVNGTATSIVTKDNGVVQDKALALLAENDVDFDPKSPEARAVLRKIDCRVMPLLLVVYILMLVDKNSISYANIMGIRDDTNLSASQYSWLGSVV